MCRAGCSDWALGCSAILVAAEEKGLVAQPGGPSSWLKSYLSSMSNAMVHTGLCQQLLTVTDGFLCRA